MGFDHVIIDDYNFIASSRLLFLLFALTKNGVVAVVFHKSRVLLMIVLL